MSENDSITTVTMKDYAKEYGTHLAYIVFPAYKQALDELSDELDILYKDTEWYNEKEKNIMLHDLLDYAMFWFKHPLWNMYNTSISRIAEEKEK